MGVWKFSTQFFLKETGWMLVYFSFHSCLLPFLALLINPWSIVCVCVCEELPHKKTKTTNRFLTKGLASVAPEKDQSFLCIRSWGKLKN